MVCQFCNLFQERLELKDREYEELQTRFTNYKLKSKARFAQLKQSIAQVTSTDDETAKNGQKKLLTDMAEANIRLEQLEDEINNLKDQLAAKQTELSDHNIKIHSLEDELRTVFEHRATSEANVIPAEDIIRRDLERMHSQMIYKDKRIMELNDTILDKERQILDLQEMCREQGQLVQAKAEACQIVRKRFMEIDSRTSREVSTETDISLIGKSTASISPDVSALKEKIDVRGRVSSSPGRAVVQFKPSNRHSPPPADPSEDKSSYTTETATFADDGEAADEPKSSTKECTPLEGKRKHRKKVTFDLPPQPSRQPVTVGNTSDGIAQAIIDLTFENDQLRRTIQEMEDLNDIDELHAHISELEDQIEQVKKDGKNQVLKARAAAQGRIHDLEEKILGIEEEYQEKISSLTASLETLRQAREWVVKENGRLLEEIESNKVNYNKLKEELEESNAEVKNLRDEMDSDRQLIIKMADDVEEAQLTASMLFDQKISILDDVERLKEAIIAQDDYINVLEADVVIYERHIGILRDSLGASKIESRALIKSKAFETKLKALEQERDQITKRNNDERLHIKALNAKIRSLEAENEQLCKKLAVSQVSGHSSNTDDDVIPELLDSSLSSEEPMGDPVHAGKTTGLELASPQQTAEENSTRPTHETLQKNSISASRNDLSGQELIIGYEDRIRELQEELEETNERLQHVECANFELESKLRAVQVEYETVKKALTEEKRRQMNEDANERMQMEVNYKARIEMLMNIEEKLTTEVAECEAELDETKKAVGLRDKRIYELERKLHQLVSQQLSSPQTILNDDSSHEADKNVPTLTTMRKEHGRADSENMHANTTEEDLEFKSGKLETGDREAAELNDALLLKNSQQDDIVKVSENGCSGSGEESMSFKEIRSCSSDASRSDENSIQACPIFSNSKPASEMRFKADTEVNESCQAESPVELNGLNMEMAQESSSSVESVSVDSDNKIAHRNGSGLINRREVSTEIERIENDEDECDGLGELDGQNIPCRSQQLRLQNADVHMTEKMKETLEEKIRYLETRVEELNNINVTKEIQIKDEEIQELTKVNLQLRQKIKEFEERQKNLADTMTNCEKICGNGNENMWELCEKYRQLEKMNTDLKERVAELENTLTEFAATTQHFSRFSDAANYNSANQRKSVTQVVELLSTASQDISPFDDSGLNVTSESESSTAFERVMLENLELKKEKAEIEQQNRMILQKLHRLEEMRDMGAFSSEEYIRECSRLTKRNEELEQVLEAMRDQLERKLREDGTALKERSQLSEEGYSLEVMRLREALMIAEKERRSEALEKQEEIGKLLERIKFLELHLDSVEQQFHSSEYKPNVSMENAQIYDRLDEIQISQNSDFSSNDKGRTKEFHLSMVKLDSIFIKNMEQEETFTDSVKHRQDSVAPFNDGPAFNELSQKYGPTKENERTLDQPPVHIAVGVQSDECVQCALQANQVANCNIDEDVESLLTLNAELETNVKALKGEIWTLNAQHKASTMEREHLSNEIDQLTNQMKTQREEAEKCESQLKEEIILMRNELQCQLVEYQMKNDMLEQRHDELNGAYCQLNEYYQQLQSAYNVLYTRVNVETNSISTDPMIDGHSFDQARDCILEVERLNTELDLRKAELIQIRGLLAGQLRNARDAITRLQTDELSELKILLEESVVQMSEHLCESLMSVTNRMRGILLSVNGNGKAVDFADIETFRKVLEKALMTRIHGLGVSHECPCQKKQSDANAMDLYQLTVAEEKTASAFEAHSLQPKNEISWRSDVTDAGASTSLGPQDLLQNQNTFSIVQDSPINQCSPTSNQRVRAVFSPVSYSGAAGHLKTQASKQLPCSTHLQVAILAARLTTKIADNDALFRCNAELAETNVRLQSEVDELKTKLDQLKTEERLGKSSVTLAYEGKYRKGMETETGNLQSASSEAVGNSRISNEFRGSHTLQARDPCADVGDTAIMKSSVGVEVDDMTNENGQEAEFTNDRIEKVKEPVLSDLNFIFAKNTKQMTKEDGVVFKKHTEEDVSGNGSHTEDEWGYIKEDSVEHVITRHEELLGSTEESEPVKAMDESIEVTYEVEVVKLQAVREELELKLKESREEAAELRHEIELLKEDMDSLRAHNEEMDVELRDERKHDSDDIEELCCLEAVTGKTQRFDHEMSQTEEDEAVYADTKNLLDETESIKHDRDIAVNGSDRGSEVTVSKASSYSETVAELRVQNEELRADVEDIRRIAEGLQEKIGFCQGQSSVSDRQNLKLVKRMQELEDELSEMVKVLEKSRASAERKRLEEDELQRTIKQKEEEISALSSEIILLKGSKDLLESEVKKLRSNLEVAQELAERSRGELSDGSEANGSPENYGCMVQLKSALERCEELELEVNSLKSDSESLVSELDCTRKRGKQKVDELESDIAALKKQNDLLKDSECKLMDSLTSYAEKLEHREEELRCLKIKVGELEGNIVSITSEKDQMENEKIMISANAEQLELHLNEKVDELLAAQAKVIQLEKVVTESGEKIVTLESDVVKSTQRISYLEQQLVKALEDQRNRLCMVRDVASSPIPFINEEEASIVKLEMTMKDYEAVVSERNRLRLRIAEMKPKCDKLIRERNQLLFRMKEMRLELENFRKKEASLQEELNCTTRGDISNANFFVNKTSPCCSVASTVMGSNRDGDSAAHDSWQDDCETKDDDRDDGVTISINAVSTSPPSEMLGEDIRRRRGASHGVGKS